MTNCLHLKLLNVLRFLAFVSLLSMQTLALPAIADEFEDFEEEQIQETTPPSKASSAPVSVNPDESREVRIERLKAEVRKSPKNTRQIGELGKELFDMGENDKVIALLWKHIDKIDRDGVITLARAHEKNKDGPEMIRALNMLTGKNPKDFEAHYYTGHAYMFMKKNKQAMESYKQAVEINPKFEPAYDALIGFYGNRTMPNHYELRIIYQDMIKALGPKPNLLAKLCQVNTEDGIYEPAIFACRDAISKNKQSADSYVYLGLAFKGMGENVKYEAEIKKAATNFPQAEISQFHYGKLLEDQKNFIEAMKYYKNATEADGTSARSWMGLATSSFELKKYEIAHPAYKKACELDKKTALAFRRATTVLRNIKNKEWVLKFETDSETCTFNN